MMPSSQLFAATPNGGYTSSRQLRHHSCQCNISLMKMMSILFAFSYLLSCHAFYSASSWSSFTCSRIAAGAPSRTSNNRFAHPSREGVGRQFRTTAVVVQGQKDNVKIEHGDFSAKFCSNSRLFPQNQTLTRRRSRMHSSMMMMMMAANDSSPMTENNLSNKVSSHVKVWNSLRNTSARLWVSNFLSTSDNYSASPVGLTQHLNF